MKNRPALCAGGSLFFDSVIRLLLQNLTFPDLPTSDPEGIEDGLPQLLEQLCPDDDTIKSFFGRELRVCWFIAHSGYDFSDIRFGLEGFNNGLIDKAFLKLYRRPIVEPVILSFLQQSAADGWDIEKAVWLASALRTIPTSAAKFPMQSRGGDGLPSVSYDLGGAERWQRVVIQIPSSFAGKIERALACYAATAIMHPLRDGNGIFARATISIELSASSTGTAIFLPMSPIIYKNMTFAINLIHRLCETSNWTEYFCSMRRLLKHAATLALRDRRLIGF